MSEAEDNDSGAETLEENDELDFITDQIKKGGLKFLAGIDDNKPLIGPRSIKTKAKILPPPRMESPEDNRRRKNRKRSLMLEGYEVESRKASTWGDGSDSFRLLLPVKTKHGIVQQTTSAPEMPSSSSSESDEEYGPPTLPEDIDEEMWPKTTVQPTVQSQSTVELFVSRQEKLAENKTLLATTANKILENPEENISLLKTLKVMCLEKDPQVAITTRKLAMISFAQVVKDIAPGYHIRTDGQEKTQVKLSKEVRRLRGFEQGLLSMYQQYLSILGETIDTGLAPKGAFGKKRKKNLHISTLDSGVSLTEVALKGLGIVALNCLCDLLTTLPHFNFSTNILVVLVPLLDHKDRKVSDLCCKALCSVFEEDLVGEISLEAVKLVASMVKNRKYKIRPEALEVFCHLRLHNVDPPTAESQVLPQSKRAKKTKPKLSRQERKQQKALEKVEHELKETEAEESRSKKTKIQTEVLNQVFVTYFRILKHAPDSHLVSPAMRGLAKFAHLINVDFFADLMSIFSSLLASGTLSNEVSLNCVATALQILSGQGELLNIDPRQFYVKLYQSILELGSSNQDCVETALGCLDKAFKKRHQVSIQRIAAFLKRLSVVNLQLLPPASLAVMATIRSFMHGYPRCEMLLDVDTPTAVYQPELPDPDVCHADATNLWELSLVVKHYHPTVALYGKHLIKGASSQGPGSLPPHLSKKSVSELLKAYALSEEDPFVSVPLPPPHPADKADKKGKTYRYRDLPLQQNSLFLVGNSS